MNECIWKYIFKKYTYYYGGAHLVVYLYFNAGEGQNTMAQLGV